MTILVKGRPLGSNGLRFIKAIFHQIPNSVQRKSQSSSMGVVHSSLHLLSFLAKCLTKFKVQRYCNGRNSRGSENDFQVNNYFSSLLKDPEGR